MSSGSNPSPLAPRLGSDLSWEKVARADQDAGTPGAVVNAAAAGAARAAERENVASKGGLKWHVNRLVVHATAMVR